jgi:adenylate kinase
MTGMPGAGKGTISEMLKSNPNIDHISTGDLFRGLDKESDLGRRVAEIMNAGQMVGDDIVNEMVAPRLTGEKDLLLDGYPRSTAQAEWLMERAAAGFEIVAILLAIDETIATARRDERVRNLRAKGLEPRADDADPEILPKRFAEYREKTEPMLDLLRARLGDNFYTINNTGTAEQAVEKIAKIIN